jgi:hypothetical protein
MLIAIGRALRGQHATGRLIAAIRRDREKPGAAP